jgi:hypothetical protein
MTPVMVIDVFYMEICDTPHYILRVFMLRIFPYILCDISHIIREDTRLCYRRLPIMVIEVSYNYYLTLFIIIFYKLRNYYSFSKNFYNFIFS